METLGLSVDFALTSASEKARSEFIVVPILLELERRNQKRFAIHSGWSLDIDKAQGLNGECDFILSRGEVSYDLRSPIFALVEAKKTDIEASLGQCVAQMIGAGLFNQQDGLTTSTIFGCVTTGETWLFLKLVDQALLSDRQRYYLSQLGQILGVLQSILDFYDE